MFSGIVQAVGRVARVEELGFGRRVTVEAPSLGLDDVRVGDSIAVNGACMTVTRVDARSFCFDVSAESLRRTTGLDAPGDVNLEKSLRLGDRLDGHLVSGHVDATGTVVSFDPIAESWRLVVEAPAALAPLIAVKGSVTINGVSLTVNDIDDGVRGGAAPGCRFSVNLIPHTMAATNLAALRVGARVNLEADLIARYVARMLAGGGRAA
jgi:riboflavin synthase